MPTVEEQYGFTDPLHQSEQSNKEHQDQVNHLAEELNKTVAAFDNQDATFEISFQLGLDRIETVKNVISYAFVYKPINMLVALCRDAGSQTGLRLVMANLENIAFVDAPYAPDKLEDVLGLIEKPSGDFWEAE